jgi:hypothetical protein
MAEHNLDIGEPAALPIHRDTSALALFRVLTEIVYPHGKNTFTRTFKSERTALQRRPWPPLKIERT